MPPPTSACELALAALPQTLLVGVSGGVDSVALLDALVRSGFKPTVLHFDHGWRQESASEALRVRDLARQLGVEFHGAKMRSSTARKSEAGARAARYAFFSRAARRFAKPNLVLAHHADDQVETFLLQLLRGGGSAAHGMDSISQRDGLVLHRPWLGIWKTEILHYARLHQLTWDEDKTNADPHYRRNLIRHRLLPYLRKQISARVAEHLWRAAEILRAESAWLDDLCREAANKPVLVVRSLRAAPLAQQRRTILRWLQARGVLGIGFAEVEAVRQLLTDGVPARTNLSEGRFARRQAGKIFVE